jgi:hypothetical protein
MLATTMVVTGMLVWVLATFAISWMRQHRRPDLAERLRPFQPGLAEEAEDWLRRQP